MKQAIISKSEKLETWQRRLADSNAAYSEEVERMDEREKLYDGNRTLKPLTEKDTKRDGTRKSAVHVRNIIFENIESQVSSSIPKPKVTPKREQDEHLADIIEHFLRNELDRLPMEEINDMAERTVPIQGAVGFLVEWDNTKRSHGTVGAVNVTLIHPKQFGPQPGVYTGIPDMDWFIIKLPTTKQAVKRKFGIELEDQSESEPDVRSTGAEDVNEDALTQYIGYELNENGGINRYTWVNDTELEDLENYQARRQPVCKVCGRVQPLHGEIIEGMHTPPPEQNEYDIDSYTFSETMTATGEPVIVGMPLVDETPKPVKYSGGPCPYCGSDEWTKAEQDFEAVMAPMETSGGRIIPGLHPEQDENGLPVMSPTYLPYYKPDVYPIVLQRSVSVYGKLLGNSDVDIIADQQNTVNRMEQKVIDRLIKAGTRVTLPAKAQLRSDPEDGERWYLENPAEKSMIDVYQFSGNLQYEMQYLAQVYEESRQLLGITDSFQGRRDTTATSGKAKEFSAAQAAGRLESKRVMKQAAYAKLFEMMFKFWLAYSDEPRPVSYKDSKGQTVYESFDRYDFLEQDEDGTYWWNDQFLFSCDTSEPLASNREAMWQETRMNLETGAFGDPASLDTLILFWTKMEELHYPGAGQTKAYLEDRKEQEMLQQQQMMAMQQQQQAMQQQQQAIQQAQAGMGGGQLPPELAQAIDQRARQDAARAAGMPI